MKRILNTILVATTSLVLTNCTDDFDEFNTDPYGITDESLEQDGNNIGGFVNSMQPYIRTIDAGLQVEENLTGDAFSQFLVPPTPFVSNRNNVTYNFTWYDRQMSLKYNNIMAYMGRFEINNVDENYPDFYAWGLIHKVFAMHKVTDNYGPIMYSQYGSSTNFVPYDSQEQVYTQFFAELDQAVSTLADYADSEDFVQFDNSSFGGNVSQWIRAANSLRLRLAMRIVKVDPSLAQQEAEKAIANPYGVMESNEDNLRMSLLGNMHPLWMFSNSWQDTRMSATMESILGGYEDPRLPVYFQPATDEDVAGEFKGIRQGIEISSKNTYVNFSAIGTMFSSATDVKIMTASEVAFLRAEGALRGWNMGGSAEDFYAQGVQLSFDEFNTAGASDYLADATSTFADYTDPKNPENSFSGSSDVTIAWDDAASNELKLEKIITQKWISLFPNGQEAWSEFRRTGYPRLIPVVVNYSGGLIDTEEFVRRTPFPSEEYNIHNEGVQTGVELLGGPDNGGTRVWWDTGASNF
ncbi:Susd and RagB outer membrane lipoprotein [Zunongwangia mangrovi]|uniref:Susd and RagB outer membrane lipoprotein n=1 Tax=Zunongwangia mangrovi TaxID=1334022 RepID=A0A1I1ERU0_9FLAO|nr:RagB/SusD family nutrient uptake outer membrane protein [Zunongwangia mangrovi]SFB87630.1 Susd and RagB outer membrane lipoprotein [Zunongwangia mangrovi]